MSAGPLPLYSQVQMALRREIESGMKPGDALETEPELLKRFGVSRITIRRALDELVAEGLIVRQQGRGTFVREPQITQDLARLLSWTASMRQLGYDPQTMSIEMDIVEPDATIRALLQSPPKTRVVRIRRVRGAQSQPACIMTNYLPEGLVPHIEERGLIDDSVYATLAAHGLAPRRVEDTGEGRAATQEEAEALQIEPGDPLLEVTRLSFDAIGRPLDIAIVSSRADRYSYAVRFEAGTWNGVIFLGPTEPVSETGASAVGRTSGDVHEVRG